MTVNIRFFPFCLLAIFLALPSLAATKKLSKPQFIANADATVTDKANKLRWTKCALGKSGGNCEIGDGDRRDFDGAKKACATLKFAGRKWRLPSKEELESLIDTAEGAPVIQKHFFPGTPAFNFISATAYAENPSHVWGTDFSTGRDTVTDKTSPLFVRCVAR